MHITLPMFCIKFCVYSVLIAIKSGAVNAIIVVCPQLKVWPPHWSPKCKSQNRPLSTILRNRLNTKGVTLTLVYHNDLLSLCERSVLRVSLCTYLLTFSLLQRPFTSIRRSRLLCCAIYVQRRLNGCTPAEIPRVALFYPHGVTPWG